MFAFAERQPELMGDGLGERYSGQIIFWGPQIGHHVGYYLVGHDGAAVDERGRADCIAYEPIGHPQFYEATHWAYLPRSPHPTIYRVAEPAGPMIEQAREAHQSATCAVCLTCDGD